MTLRRVVALAQASAMIMLLLPGPARFGPVVVEAARQPAVPDAGTVYDVAGKGIGCEPGGGKYRGPGLPKDPPWPPGAEPTPSPTPEPTPIVDDPALDAGTQPEPEPSAEASEEPQAFTYGFAQGLITPTSELVTGIDVSHHNGDIDYGAVKEAGHRFVFIKATQDNDFIDPMFPTNLARARAAGLAAGAYHFFDYTLDGRDQADHFLDRVEAAGGIDDALPPVVDVECWSPIGASIHAVAAARLRDFVERVYERTGRWPLIYTSTLMWREVAGNAEGFEDLPMWAACWGCEPPISIAPGWDEWLFWQEGLTRIPGVGRLDGNYFKGSRKELRALELRPFAIAGGDPATSGGRVELDLGGRVGSHIRTSTDGETWSTWSQLGTRPTIRIPSQEGSYQVYAQLRGAPGLKSPVMRDSIFVDATPPEVSPLRLALGVGPLGASDAALPLRVGWEARDATAGVADAEVAVSCGDDWDTSWEAPGQADPGATATWDAQAWAVPDVECSVTAITLDGAGNSARTTVDGLRTTIVPVGADGRARISGTGVGVVARRGPDAGRVAVMLDGQAIGLVDLAAEGEESPSVVYVAELSEGEHTISVEATDGDDAGVSVEAYVTLDQAT